VTKQPQRLRSRVREMSCFRGGGMKRRCAKLLRTEESLRKSIVLCGCPYIALRDEEASRAGRYLEGTCALAIRPCNR
jgi:hypothetical protein